MGDVSGYLILGLLAGVLSGLVGLGGALSLCLRSFSFSDFHSIRRKVPHLRYWYHQ